jgi:hypothetical protein
MLAWHREGICEGGQIRERMREIFLQLPRKALLDLLALPVRPEKADYLIGRQAMCDETESPTGRTPEDQWMPESEGRKGDTRESGDPSGKMQLSTWVKLQQSKSMQASCLGWK